MFITGELKAMESKMNDLCEVAESRSLELGDEYGLLGELLIDLLEDIQVAIKSAETAENEGDKT